MDSDLANARSTEYEKRLAVAHQIREACLTAGFFYGKSVYHGLRYS